MRKYYFFFLFSLLYHQHSAQSWEKVGNYIGDYFGGGINCIAAYNNKLVVGGSFGPASMYPLPFERVAIFQNGTWESIGQGIQNDLTHYNGDAVNKMVSYQNNLLAVGCFWSFGGNAYIEKWNGSNWTRFNDTLSTLGCVLEAINVNNKFIIGVMGGVADMTNPNGNTNSSIGEWDGTLDIMQAEIGTGGAQWKGVWSIAEYQGQIYAGGDFFHYPSGENIYLARYDGSHWYALPLHTTDRITKILAYGGELYVVWGNFTSPSGAPMTAFSKWNGTNWEDISLDTDQYIKDMLVYGNKLFVTGSFGKTNDSSYVVVMSFDGQNWQNEGEGSAMGTALGIVNDSLYVAGAFTRINNIYSSNVVKYTQKLLSIENEIINTNIHIYPNPSDNFLNVYLDNWDKEEVYWEVCNILGENKACGFSLSSSFKVECEMWTEGVYVLKIHTTEGVYTQKFIHQ